MEAAFPETNSVWMMVNSGARGNPMQVRQIAGMREAGEGRLFCEKIFGPPGLGVLLRQVQAGQVQGHHLRALRRRGHPGQGAARADGPHRAGRAGHAHLVLQGCAEPARVPARPGAEGPGEGHLLRGVHDHVRGRRGPGRATCPASRRRSPSRSSQLEQRRDADVEARQAKLEKDLAELEAAGAKGDARRKVRESADRECRQIRDRAGREIDRIEEVWNRFRGSQGPGPGGRRAALPRDAGPVRPLLPRRHGRAGHPGAGGQLRPRGRGAPTCGRPSAPARASARRAR